jgi:hypothetical protein
MSKHARRRRPLTVSPRKRRLGAALVTIALVATGSTLMPANAVTTVGATESGPNGPVVRASSVNVSVDTAALNYYRTGTAASINNVSYTASSLSVLKTLKAFGRLCNGDNPAPGGKNNSARTIVTVKDPNNATVASATSPVRDISAFGSGGPVSPQPAPGDTNYRGDYPGTGGTHGLSLTVNLTGKPAGVYTVTTEDRNMAKSDSTGINGSQGPCVVGRPDATGKVIIPGPVVTTTTFEYRPWQANFKDVFGKGSVSANVNPAEYQFTVGSKSSPIYQGAGVLQGNGNSQQFYALPGGGGFPLPSDPQACIDNPSTCLPSNAVKCDPSAGCTPRVMLINRPKTAANVTGLVGAFDLDTKAFIAYATIDGTTRLLTSLGTVNDAYYHNLLDKLAAGAAAKGLDLASILATEVRVSNGNQVLSLSLLNGLQIDPTTVPGGIQIGSDATVQAGIILNIYLALEPTSCASKSASSTGSESTPKTDRFTRSAASGYTVTKSDLLPEVPRVGPLGAIVGGPLYHIVGTFSSSTALLNTTSTLLGLDTAADEPNGYPVWIEPFLSAGHVVAAKKMDFLGTATWSASESSLGSLGCLVTDFMLGTGVAVLNNPLPVGLGTIFDPLATPSPAAETLTDAVNDAVDQVVGQAATNPTVSALLTQVTALLPLA